MNQTSTQIIVLRNGDEIDATVSAFVTYTRAANLWAFTDFSSDLPLSPREIEDAKDALIEAARNSGNFTTVAS